MKKIIGIILSAAMLLSTMSAYADEEQTQNYSGDSALQPNLWVTGYSENKEGTPWDLTTEYWGINSNEAKDGNKSLCVNIAKEEPNRLIYLQRSFATAMVANKNYRLSFWIKGQTEGVVTAFEAKWYGKYLLTQYTQGETVNGWTNYYSDFTVEEDKVPTWIRVAFAKKASILIDDISIREITGETLGDNIMTNGSFEDCNYKFIDDVTERAAVGVYIANPANLIKTNNYAKVTSRYAHSGNYALHIVRDTEKAAAWENYKIMSNFSKKLDAGEYTVEFYMKGSMASSGTEPNSITVEGVGLSKIKKPFTEFTNIEKETNGWTKYSTTITIDTTDNATGLNFRIGRECDIVIDDVKVYKTNNPSVNLYNNGDFENVVKVGSLKAANEYKTSSWDIFSTNAANSNGYGTTMFIEPSDKEAYSGKYSMNVNFDVNEVIGSCYARMLEPHSWGEGTYNLEFYTKGAFDPSAVRVGMVLGSAWSNGLKYLNSEEFTKSDAGNGWTRYNIKITKTEKSDCLFFIFDRSVFNVFIDNISLTSESEPGVNLMTNGDFENTSSTTKVSNPIVYPTVGENSATVSWVNPDNDGITNIKVYVNDVEKTFTADTAAAAQNVCYVTDLSVNGSYTVKIVLTIGENTYTCEIPYVAKNYGMDYALTDGWLATRHDKDGNYANTQFVIDNEEKAGGKYSLRIDANMKESKPNVFATIAQNISGLKRNIPYRLKLKAKATGVNHFYLIESASVKDSSNATRDFFWQPSFIDSSVPVSTDWKEYTIDLTPELSDGFGLYDNFAEDSDVYTATIQLAVNRMNGNLWIDDIGVYAVDEFGNIIGNNLLTNGDFESIEDFEAATIFAVEKDGVKEPITEIQPGNIILTTSLKNNAKGDGFKTAVIYAIYKNDSLYNFTKVEKAVDETAYTIPADSFETTINIPNDENTYSVKVMYWNGFDSLVPIGRPDELR